MKVKAIYVAERLSGNGAGYIKDGSGLRPGNIQERKREMEGRAFSRRRGERGGKGLRQSEELKVKTRPSPETVTRTGKCVQLDTSRAIANVPVNEKRFQLK